MPADKRHVNWTTTTWTPAGGVLVTLVGVRSVERGVRGEILTFSGDGDALPTTKAAVFQDPLITVRASDLNTQIAIPFGGRGAFASTLNAAKQKVAVGGGGFTLSQSNSIIEDSPFGGQHRAWAEGSIMIGAESTDGLTSPQTITPL